MRARVKTIYAATVKKSSAVTFIELILIITITAVLIGLGLPRFRRTFTSFEIQNTSRQLHSFMNYLSQRAIVEKKIVTLTIENDAHRYWARIDGAPRRLKTFTVPDSIKLTASENEIMFYPDGTIDKATIKLSNENTDSFLLSTEGAFGNVKINLAQ